MGARVAFGAPHRLRDGTRLRLRHRVRSPQLCRRAVIDRAGRNRVVLPPGTAREPCGPGDRRANRVKDLRTE